MKVLFSILVFSLCRNAAAGDADSAAAWVAQGQPHRGAQVLERAKDQGATDLATLQASARLLASTGHPRLAMQRWKEVLAADSGNAEAIEQLGVLAQAAALPEPASPTSTVIEPGQGLWVDGDIRAGVKTINTFNLKAPLRQRVRQTYVKSGQLLLVPGHCRWALDLRPLQMAADTQAGDTRAQLWIQVDGRRAEGLTSEDIERAATELADALKDEKRVSGLLLEPRPAKPSLYPLYTALRRHLPLLPLTVVVGSALPSDFAFADVLMLRAWPRDESVEAYRLRIGDEMKAFLRAGEKAGAKAMVALPGSLAGAGKAAPYLEAGTKALSAALAVAPGAYIGYSLHGMLPKDDGTQTDLEPEVWALLSLPVTP